MFKQVEVGGLKFYHIRGTQINITNEEVTESNYEDVMDIDVMNVYSEELDSTEKIDKYARSYMADIMLEKLSDDLLRTDLGVRGQELANILQYERGYRENYVLSEYASFDIEGDILEIRTKEGESIDIDLREESFGKIVG